MRRAIFGTLILALLPCLAQAQSDDYPKWHGYGYIGPGGKFAPGLRTRATLQIGVGLERYFTRRFGVSGDAGYAGRLGPGKFSSGWGMLSGNFVARFPRKDEEKKVEPFVTAGYTRIMDVGNRDYHGINFGAGFNWWVDKRAALRVEVRDHIQNLLSQGAPVHFLGLRIGVTFR